MDALGGQRKEEGLEEEGTAGDPSQKVGKGFIGAKISHGGHSPDFRVSVQRVPGR
jgi:hypothetical protein